MFGRLKKDPTDLMDIPSGVLRGLSFKPPKEVDRPTYRVVGDIERVDERDTVHARMDIRSPGSPRYDEYYGVLHPELRLLDDETKAMAAKSAQRRQEKSPAERVLAQLELAGFYGASALGLPDAVNTRFRIRQEAMGNYDVADENNTITPVRMDPLEMALKVKALGLHLGAAKVRVTELKQQWVYSRTMTPWGKPPDLNYKYLICMSVLQEPFLIGGGFQHSGHALEVGFKYAYASMLSIMVANFIKRLGWPARALPTFNSPYLVCPTFIDAGVGEDGRCAMVVAKEIGNNWRPGAVATDIPLVIDKPVDFGLQDFCDKCKICAEACPSGAIPKGGREKVRGIWKWQIDPVKCQQFWMKTGHNCAMCQKACPWNHPSSPAHNLVREVAERYSRLRRGVVILEDFFYGKTKKPGPDPKWLTEELAKYVRKGR